MDYLHKFKTWKVVDWNSRGINSEAKQLAIREKNGGKWLCCYVYSGNKKGEF
jgi:hypothetical protein